MLASFLAFMNTQYFNAYDVILLLTFIQAMTFTILLLTRVDIKPTYFLLPAFIGSVGLGQLSFFFLWNDYGRGLLSHVFTIQNYGLLSLPFFLQGPLLYHYMRALTNGKIELKLWDYGPVAFFLFFYILNVVERFGGFYEYVFWRDYVFMGTIGFFISCLYGVKSVCYLQRYSESLKNKFGSIERMDFIWLKIFAWGFFIIWFLEVLPPFFFKWASWSLNQVMMHSKNLLEMFMVSFVIFASLIQARKVQPIDLTDETEMTAKITDGISSEVTKEEIDAVAQRLKADKLYLKPGLTVEQLANHVNLPVKTLSLIINRYYEKNFYDFVNHYRVMEARRLLKSEEHAKDSIQDIYESVGFRSKSSFNTLFKKTVGVTPSKYREKYGMKRSA